MCEIEDTIFDNILPVNLFPMIHRLEELSKMPEHKDLRNSPNIKKLMWLLTATFYKEQISLDLHLEWQKLYTEYGEK